MGRTRPSREIAGEKTEYIRVTPTSEELRIAAIPAVLESLHKLTNPDANSLTKRLNPFTDTSPPTFQFLAISEGEGEPVEFYYGVDQPAHLETLEKRLRTIYPSTFDVVRNEVDLEAKLVQPVEYSRDEYRERLERGDLLRPPSKDDRSLSDEESRVGDGGRTFAETNACATADRDASPESEIHKFDPKPGTRSRAENRSTRARPALEDEETVRARPPITETEPVGIRWYARAERKRDWMTTIKSFANQDPDPVEYDLDRPTVAVVVEHLTEITAPVAFQVVWRRKPEWVADAELRKEDLRDGRDTRAQRFIGPLFEFDAEDGRGREPVLGSEARSRIDRIDAKHPKRTFTVNIRAIAVPTDDDERLEREIDQLARSLDALDGPFYGIEGARLRSNGTIARRKRKRARAALRRLFEAELVTGRGRRRPEFVLNGDELANVVVVPSSADLTVEGTRGARSEQQSRNPLPRPNPDLLESFREGMAIGYALDENGEPEAEPVRIPPSLLPTHYVRAATTGGGKSKALINDMLTLYEETTGPVILIDAKGDGLCENYMRSHAHRFGFDDLEANVLHFPVPDVLPGFAFFNLEPALENGVRRVDAVQSTADHYEEILKLVMGEERYERAVVAPTLIKYLIKTLFDEEYGRENGRYRESEDYFAHEQLEHVVDQLWQAGPPGVDEAAAPRSSDPQVSRRLDRQLQLDPNSFATVMGGVSNRLDYVSQDAHLRRIFDNTESRFDFRELLDERTVILFDLGGLREESAKAMTGLICTQLYDALRERGDAAVQKSDEYVVNLLIDEASSLADSGVMSTLLEKGRSFRLSVGLSLQFPEQLRVKGNHEVYLNVLNDVGSSIVGQIAVDADLATAMAHEGMDPATFANRIRSLPRGEWIARLPSPRFGETGPVPFSLAPLPIPPGHPESDEPFTPAEERAFRQRRAAIHSRASAEYGVGTYGPPSARTPDAVREAFDLRTDELDAALAEALRTAQLQRDVRAENGWVPVSFVYEVLRRRYEAVDESPPSLEAVDLVRARSRFLESSREPGASEPFLRLTDAGEAMTEPDTGEVMAAGGADHDALLLTVEAALTSHGFDVTIFTQDGTEMPDGRAMHSDLPHEYAIEAEWWSVGKPVNVLEKYRRAHEEGTVPLFVVSATGNPHGDGRRISRRIERNITTPYIDLESGEKRLYLTNSRITFQGGANAREGITAVRPATDDSRRTYWSLIDGRYVLHDGQGTEFASVSSFEALSRSDVPAGYCLDRSADEYVVYEGTDRHVYDSKADFEAEWVPIVRPFVPAVDLPTSTPSRESFEVLIIDLEAETVRVYRNGELYPISVLLEDEDDEKSADVPADGSESPSNDSPSSSSENEASSSSAENTSGTSEDDHDRSSLLSGDADESSDAERNATQQADNPRAADLRTFSETVVRVDAAGEIREDVLFGLYQTYLAIEGKPGYTKAWFGRKLADHVSFDRIEDDRGIRYEGITLTDRGRELLESDAMDERE